MRRFLNLLSEIETQLRPFSSRSSYRRRAPAWLRRALFEQLEIRDVLATLTVNTLADSVDADPGTTSLREAITAANIQAGDDTIAFSVRGTINLTAALPELSSNIQINGPGADQLTVRRDTGGDYRIFTVAGNAHIVGLDGLTMANGNAPSNAFGFYGGGGIYNDPGNSLTISNSHVTGNSAFHAGGGIYNAGTMIVTNSVVSDNFREGISSEYAWLTVSSSTVTRNTGSGISNYGVNSMLSVNDSTVSNNIGGGGIHNHRGTTTLSNSIVSGNSSSITGVGGGITSNNGSVVLNDTTVSGNSAPRGGGIYSRGTFDDGNGITINNGTLTGNSALESGGGIFIENQFLKITNSTLSTNHANQDGGGINDGSFVRLTITNSTLSGNSAGRNGGGIYDGSAQQSAIINCTLTGNSAGQSGGSIATFNRLSIYNSIVANSPTGGDISGPYIGGPNLLGTVLLGPLQNNGGSTLTHALPAGSPAIDAGANFVIPTEVTTDQRGEGYPRVYFGTVDIGAWEDQTLNQAETTVVLTSSTDPSVFQQPVTFTATVSAAVGTPNGTVDFYDGSTLLSTKNLVNGSAHISISNFSVQDHPMRAVYSGAHYFAAAEGSLLQTVLKADQSISFEPLPDLAYGAGPSLTASASTGLPVSFAVVSGPATVSGDRLTINGVGTVIVAASQAGNGNFNPASVQRSFNVVPAPLDSTLDPTFGEGGKVSRVGIYPLAMDTLSNGRILVLGGYEILRYSYDGSLDATFGTNGIQPLGIEARGMHVLTDGSILVYGTVVNFYRSGYYGSYPNQDIALVRFTPTGQLDFSFGDNGRQTIDFREFTEYGEYDPNWPIPTNDVPTAISVLPDGNIYIYAVSSGEFGYFENNVVAALTPDGRLNASFGHGGKDFAEYGPPIPPALAPTVAVQDDGKTITVGHQYGDFSVTRTNPDSSLDSGFGLQGTQLIDFGEAAYATTVAIHPNGAIVVAGWQSGQLKIARLLGGVGLLVDGTADNDVIAIDAGTQPGTLKTTINGIVTDNVAVAGYVLVNGLSGNDTFTLNAAPASGVVVAGGDGSDSYSISFGNLAGEVVVSGGGEPASGTDNLVVYGTSGDDFIFKDNHLITLGNPVLESVPYFGIESLTLHGGLGDDTIVDPGSHTYIFGDAGNDTITITATSGDGVTVDGGAGSDLYFIGGGDLLGPVTVSDSGTSGTDHATILGTEGDDSIVQSGNVFTLNGVAISIIGMETATVDGGGGAGDSFSIQGPPSIPVTVQGLSHAVIDGTAGNDHIRLAATNRAGEVKVYVNNILIGTFVPANYLIVNGLAGNDVISAEGVNVSVVLDGGEGNDTITGGGGDDVLFGGLGDDAISGGAGNDSLIGGVGKDRIVGAAGHDILVSGDLDASLDVLALQGISQQWAAAHSAVDAETTDAAIGEMIGDAQADQLTGSSGADLFFTNFNDIITDFKFDKRSANEDGDVVIRDGVII